MMELIRALLSPLLSLVLMNLACGLFNTFVSIRLDLQGYSADTVGIVSASLYGGVLIGSLRLSRWISRVGHIFAFTVFCSISAILVLGHAIWIDPWYWSFLRLMSGVCLAGIFIVVESWFLLQSSAQSRSGALSIYLGVFYLALSAGQFLINFSPVTTVAPFYISAFLLGTSILPMKMVRSAEPPRIENPASNLSLREMFRLSPLGFWGGIISGMILGAVYGLTPVYATSEGLSVFEIGFLMSILIFGGLSFQWPMGRWADRSNRRNVLTFSCFGAVFSAIAIGLFGSLFFPLLLVLVWIFGGFSFTIYPLSMAYLCEKVAHEQIVSATGGFVLCYAIGAIAGPLLAPIAMDLMGGSGLFYFQAFLLAILGSCSTKNASKISTTDQ